MRILVLLIVCGVLMLGAGCTPTGNGEKPKVLCPACGTEFDSIYHKHF